MSDQRGLRHRLSQLIRQHDGVLTRELVKTPGRFGLGLVPAKLEPQATTTTICGYCSTGCGLNVHLKDGEAVNLTPSAQYPVNRGMACPKGWEALSALAAEDRATTPLLRRDGTLEPVDWNTATRTLTERFKAIQAEYGRDAIAFLSTGQIVSEEMAFLGALAKFGMGIPDGDGNTRQCMATTVTAYKQAFGFDAPPYTYADLLVMAALLPAAAAWELNSELPRFSVAVNGAAELLGVMIEEGIPREEVEGALSRLLDDIEARIAENEAMGGPPQGTA